MRLPFIISIYSNTEFFRKSFRFKAVVDKYYYIWLPVLPASKPNRSDNLTCCLSFLLPASPAASWLPFSSSTAGQLTFIAHNHTASPTRRAASLFSYQHPLLPLGSPTTAGPITFIFYKHTAPTTRLTASLFFLPAFLAASWLPFSSSTA